jgi:site-specific DNA-cytosine methylase
MLHLGDITKISGYTAPIVDVVVGGSPCQDLSVAGKRAGLDGERSGLFMEQLRIIKEMRERDRKNGRTDVDIRPRYMVWENVPGAFSSNKAEDFRIVLEETAKVADKDAVIPMPDKGKWTTSGCILGDGWSIAWRVCDAQFYGVPQRRRRIALVADFGGQSAPEILFVRKSVSRDSEQSQPKGKETPTNATRGIGADDIFCIDGDKLNKKERKGGSGLGVKESDKQYTLTAKDVHGVAYCFEPGAAKRLGGYVWEDLAPTLRTEVGDNRPSVAYTMQDREGKAGGGKGALIAEELSATLRAGFAQTLFQPVQCIDQGGGKSACNVQEGQAPTLTCTHGGEPAVCYSIENHPADSRVDIDESGKVQILTSRMGTGGGNVPMVMECFSKSKRAQTDTDYETWKESDVANTLNAFDVGDKRTTECVVALDRAAFNQGQNALYDFEVSDKGVNSPLVAKGPGAVCYSMDEENILCKIKRLYAMNSVGGALHVVLDDENIEDKHILWCLLETIPKVENAEERKLSEDIANELLKMTEDDREDLMELFWRPKVEGINGDKAGTLDSSYYKGCGMRQGVERDVVRVKYIVRRLTPLECERLQGYPDGWTDIGEWTDSKGKIHKTSDAARYKALGNSIALPPWKWVLRRLCACYERDATLASLFDGISGFCLLWTQLNGLGSVKWTSEIEPFPIAVCKKHFGDEETGEKGDFYEAIQSKN